MSGPDEPAPRRDVEEAVRGLSPDVRRLDALKRLMGTTALIAVWFLLLFGCVHLIKAAGPYDGLVRLLVVGLILVSPGAVLVAWHGTIALLELGTGVKVGARGALADFTAREWLITAPLLAVSLAAGAGLVWAAAGVIGWAYQALF